MLDLICLLGPNGVGKTTLGKLLERQRGWPFLSCEGFFLSQYATLDDYYANRDEAYRSFDDLIRTTLGSGPRPLVIEEVGMSPPSQQLLRGLLADHRVGMVRLTAQPRLCATRVAARGTAENYPKDPAFVQSTWARFEELVPTLYTFDLVLDTTAATPEQLSDALAAWAAGHH